MKIITKQCDILSLDNKDYFLAHGISGDFTLGAGLAKKINDKYDMSKKLQETYIFESGKYGAFLIDNVFNLAIKDCYKDKATYGGLQTALNDLKLSLYYMNVKKIAIPRIGCGKDKLDWNIVQAMLNDTFKDMDIEIIVCVL